MTYAINFIYLHLFITQTPITFLLFNIYNRNFDVLIYFNFHDIIKLIANQKLMIDFAVSSA